MPGYAFISYSRRDREYVRSLVAALNRSGVSAWYDYELEAGDQFARRIEAAIDGCSAFILVVSPDAVGSPWVQGELARAKRRKKPLFPLLLRTADLPLEVEGLQIEDVAGGQMPTPRFLSHLASVTGRSSTTGRPRPRAAAHNTVRSVRKMPLRTSLAIVSAAVLLVAVVVPLTLSKWRNSPGGEGTNHQSAQPSIATLYVGVDLPFQGPHAAEAANTWDALNLYLARINNRVGPYTVRLVKYDNSTAALGGWDAAQCQANAEAHVANADEVAVIGTLDTGCTQVILPILNQAEEGPILMVSSADSWTGLTKSFLPDEPNKYLPTGVRNFARVIASDDAVGRSAKTFVQDELKAHRVLILDDGTAYGKGIADAFSRGWVRGRLQQTSLSADASVANLVTQASTFEAEAILFSGTMSRTSIEVMKEAASTFGGQVALVVVGELSEADRLSIPEAVSWNWISAGVSGEGWSADPVFAPARKFQTDFVTTYGDYIFDELHAVLALQVVLAAIEESDGTRAGVRNSVFEDDGILVRADVSMLGQHIRIDRATGDIDIRYVSAYGAAGPSSMARWDMEVSTGATH